MEPWYRMVSPRKEVREGRSFDPNEFAIALEQVVAGTAPDDYRLPEQFFERTVFTRALRDHASMVLRRLSGQTADTAPVLLLITQFGGGKTHTLTALYHLIRSGDRAAIFPGVNSLLDGAGLTAMPKAKVAVFVGNAWDPQDGRETPWIDIARQLAGSDGVAELGKTAETVPPGTEALAKVFQAAGGSVLVLLDEVLNFLNRHRSFAEPLYAFLQNLTVAMTGAGNSAAVISLPRSQLEMTDWDQQWQDRIMKVVRRVAKDLIVNDESEISEVVRRRLFEELGGDRARKNVAKAYAEWCFERRAQLPPEWTAGDTAATEKKARDFLAERFERCYPFHPATLSVFQRKWQALPQYQQTRGTLAMLAQWVARAYREGFGKARTEPLITLGSAPLDAPEFRGVVVGQLGDTKLLPAIDVDIAGEMAHARALDLDTQTQVRGLRDIHRRVGTAILFESSGGQTEKLAHLPELRFALGEPELDTTSIDNAAYALEARAFYIRKLGSDGFRVGPKPKLSQVVSQRIASLDAETEVVPEVRRLVEREFDRGATLPLVRFPKDSTDIADSPRLTLVVADPAWEWAKQGQVQARIAEWTRRRGESDRLYPGSLVWCIRKPGRELHREVESLLGWRRVQLDAQQGVLGKEFEEEELQDVQANVKEAERDARDEVWAAYRFLVLFDRSEPDALRVIDIGAGHANTQQTLCGRAIAALASEGLLNVETVSVGYLTRHWPSALESSGAWPLTGLRQSFLNGSLTRLIDPDRILRGKIAELVEAGEFGLGSGPKPDGTYEHVWFREMTSTDEVMFEPGVFLLRKDKAEALKARQVPGPGPIIEPEPEPPAPDDKGAEPVSPTTVVELKTLRLTGDLPPEVWNRLGTRLIPRLKGAGELHVGVQFEVRAPAAGMKNLISDLRQVLQELGLEGRIHIEE